MENENTLQLSGWCANSFSWRRVWMLFKFIYPGVKKQVILFPILTTVLTSMFIANITINNDPYDLANLITMGIGIMFMAAPIGLAHFDYRSTSALLPVTTLEKAVCLFGYFWVGVFCLTTGLEIFEICIASLIFPELEGQCLAIMKKTPLAMTPIAWFISIVIPLVIQGFVMLGVLGNSKSRMLRGLLYGLLGFVAYIFLCGISGVVAGIRAVSTFKNETRIDGEPEEALINDFISIIIPDIFMFISILGAFTFIFLVYTITKKLKQGGF